MIRKTGIVVPTLGTRPEYLRKSLQSIKASGNPYILVVAPGSTNLSELQREGLIDQIQLDAELGLSAAIDSGIRALPKEVEYVNWLGDDDLLMPGALALSETELDQNPSLSFVFGGCEYIDSSGRKIWENKSGQWAGLLLKFGPDLIPQPGALIRKSSYEQVGGLDRRYHLAFDLDLFLKLSKVGKHKYLGLTQAKFRWHESSLSVSQRQKAVREASQIRVSHLPTPIRNLSWIWEPIVRIVTLTSGRLLGKAPSRRLI